MADGADLNLNLGSGAQKVPGAKPAQNTNSDSNPLKTDPAQSAKGKQIANQNTTVYKNPSDSQLSFSNEKQEKQDAVKQQLENKSQSDLAKDYEIKAKNPVLAAKLKSKAQETEPKEKKKKPSPKPSLKTKLMRKGGPINPRKASNKIPGRLKGLAPQELNQMDSLNEALIKSGELENDPKYILANTYAKKLYSKAKPSKPFAELFNLSETKLDQLLAKGKEALVNELKEQISLLDHDSFLQETLRQILDGIMFTNNPDKYILQLFMPLPFAYDFDDQDEEFNLDEKELLLDDEDHEDKDDDSEDAELDDDLDDLDLEANDNKHDGKDILSLSVKSLNFAKLHFYLKFDSEVESFKMHMRGDDKSSELMIPIETNVESKLEDMDCTDFDTQVSNWQDGILHLIERRSLKVKSAGTLNAKLIYAAKSILDTITENDQSDENDKNNW